METSMTDEAMPDLARILPTQKTGQEEFYDGERSLGFSLLEFWQWAGSNLLSNRDRGILAEFLVGRALGVTDKLRTEWDAMDYLLTWNCKHIANAEKFPDIEQVCNAMNYKVPIICTPEELLGGYL